MYQILLIFAIIALGLYSLSMLKNIFFGGK